MMFYTLTNKKALIEACVSKNVYRFLAATVKERGLAHHYCGRRREV